MPCEANIPSFPLSGSSVAKLMGYQALDFSLVSFLYLNLRQFPHTASIPQCKFLGVLLV